MAEVLKEDDDNQHDEEIVIVEEDPAVKKAEEDEKAAKAADEDDSEEDERSTKAADEEEKNASDDEREAIRERRRLEKLERKERREKAITRDKVELEFLRKRNDDLERRFSTIEQRTYQADLNSFDQQIAAAKNEAEMAERVIAKAVEAGNGADVAQALKYRDEAIAKANQLTFAKQQAAQAKPAAQEGGMDDRVMLHAREFLDENKWYDPQGRNEDSAIVLAIDQGLVRDGFDPKTEQYWDELRARAARRLPERFAKAEPKSEQKEERTPRGGPGIGSGREHAPTSTRKEVYVSPERKQALIEAGVWDDPVLRMKYVKRYAEYDKQNRA
jgi:hypothetical protein